MRNEPDRRAAFGQPKLALGKRHVALFGEQAADEVDVHLGLGGSPIAARLARNRPAMPMRQLPPADRGCHPDARAGAA